MDPEDVRALQDPYWQHVRSELERYGGTVEKFIGDAVVAPLRCADGARRRPGARRARGSRDS